jgi:predicted lipoprotein with Yx(FWY)xxD motif
MHLRRKSILALAVASLLALALAACGGNDDSDDSGMSASASATGGTETVSTESIGGFDGVLVDSQGAALYTSDQDTGGRIACTDGCAAEWLPLAAPASGEPTSGDSSIQEKLGTVQRPDGGRQVTFEGKPLYSFVDDSPGQVTGDGFSDSFNGTTFTWTVATASGSADAGSESSAGDSEDDSGGAYGGY